MILLLLFLVGCSSVVTPPTVPITKGWHDDYTYHIEGNLFKYPAHVKYNSDRSFWSRFYSDMSIPESNHNPFSYYWEKTLGVSCMKAWGHTIECQEFITDWNKSSSRKASLYARGWDDNTKMFYLSEGLFQLSYSDANYYGCNFDIEGDRKKLFGDKSKTIFDPIRNIDCAMAIMEKQIKRHGKLLYDRSYWAVLRPNGKYFSKSLLKYK